jgi:predicted glycosyltransferase
MIWIDITNLPHVLFFRDFIKKNDCLITTREFGNLTSLLDKNAIEYTTVGRHGGKDPKSKLLESGRRVEELTRIVSNHSVDFAIAKHSVELPRVAYGLDIPSIFILDNEHAEQQNRLTLPLVSTLVTPDALDKRIIQMQGADSKRTKNFYGVCESSHLKNFKPNRKSVAEHGAYVVVRPEPYTAAYFRSEAQTQTLIDRLDSLGYRVIVLPRGGERYQNAVHLENIDSLNLIYHSKAFFGGGGTMNREAAILGVPTVSFYSQELLGVDRFLMKLGLMHHTPTLDFDLESVLTEPGLMKKAERIRSTFDNPFKVIEIIMA